MENKISLDELREIIESKNVSKLREIFESVDIIDIADVCDDLEDTSQLLFIFKTVKSEMQFFRLQRIEQAGADLRYASG